MKGEELLCDSKQLSTSFVPRKMVTYEEYGDILQIEQKLAVELTRPVPPWRVWLLR